MIGQTLLDYIDWPEEYLIIKVKKNGLLTNKVFFVEPNITDKYKNPINYKMRMLNFNKLLNLSPLVSSYEFSQQVAENIKHNGIKYVCYKIKYDSTKEEYISMSKFLPKNIALIFEVIVKTNGFRYNYPLNIKFTKTNYGKEAGVDSKEFEPKIYWIKQNNSSINNSLTYTSKVEIDEATKYRGLHTMKAEVVDSTAQVIFKDWIGILIV